MIQSRPVCLWWPINRAILTTAEVLPKKQRVGATCWAPQSGGSASGRWVPRRFGFEGNWGLLSGEPSRNRDSTLRDCTHYLIPSGTQGRNSNLKGAKVSQTHLLTLEGPSERQEATGAHLRDINTGGGHFQKLVLSWWQWCWQIPFWNIPSSSLVPEPGTTNQPVSTSGQAASSVRPRPVINPLNTQIQKQQIRQNDVTM